MTNQPSPTEEIFRTSIWCSTSLAYRFGRRPQPGNESQVESIVTFVVGGNVLEGEDDDCIGGEVQVSIYIYRIIDNTP